MKTGSDRSDSHRGEAGGLTLAARLRSARYPCSCRAVWRPERHVCAAFTYRRRAQYLCGRRMATSLTLHDLNAADQDAFVQAIGFVFEHSPWIAAAAWSQRPFESVDQLHGALCSVVDTAPIERQIDLIAAHPDLVGKAARAGTLTSQSQGEQAAAGLDRLSPEEIDAFTRYNAALWGEVWVSLCDLCPRE